MTIWFTSDNHLGHGNIIKYCNRPFSSAEEMDEHMIKLWNEHVKPNDVVYCAGDFTFGNHSKYLKRLNGIKHLISGNHDKNPSTDDGWDTVQDYLEIKHPYDKKKKIILCHYAFKVFNGSHKGNINLYGHSHDGLVDNNQQMDIGVDCANRIGLGYRPISLDEVVSYLKTRPPFINLDQH